MESFTLFPNLIPEIRITIWQHALHYPRLVLIYKHSTRTTKSSHIRRTVFSPLLSVSREARIEAIRYYFPISRYPLQTQSQNTRQQENQPYQQLSPNLFPPILEPPSTLGPDSGKPYPIFPGTDIVYISGSDPQPVYIQSPTSTLTSTYNTRPSARRASGRTPLTWALVHMTQDMETVPVPTAAQSTKSKHSGPSFHLSDAYPSDLSPTPHMPTFAPLRFLAIDLPLLQTTPQTKTPRFAMPYGIWRFIICDLARSLLTLYIVVPSILINGKDSDGQGWDVEGITLRLEAAREMYLAFWENMYGEESESEDGDGYGEDEVGGSREELKRLRAWKCPRIEVVGLGELAALCWV